MRRTRTSRRLQPRESFDPPVTAAMLPKSAARGARARAPSVRKSERDGTVPER
jgi:hypothetical protein